MTVTITYNTSTTLTYTDVTAISSSGKAIVLSYVDTASANAPTTKQFSTKELGSCTISIAITVPTE